MKKILIIIVIFTFISCDSSPDKVDYVVKADIPMFPDYSDVTFPYNISAPAFLIEDEAEKHFVKIYAQTTDTIRISAEADIKIPSAKWKKLLSENKGKPLFINIYGFKEKVWYKYETVRCHIDSSAIDPYLVYRLVTPGTIEYKFLGIYERNLTNYDERLVFSNKYSDNGCVNCHNFNQNDPNQMLMHLRISNAGLIKIQNDDITKIDNAKTADIPIKLVYPSWHPSGDYIAFSTNQVKNLAFLEPDFRYVDAVDTLSDIVLYDVKDNTIIHFPELSKPDYEELQPAWSADGTKLYFCASEKQKYREGESEVEYMFRIRFNLMVADFDRDKLAFGEPRLVVDAAASGRSVSFPRVSNDGRFLMYSETDHNAFPIARKTADLRLLDLETGRIDSLNIINSNVSESFHSWSSDSRWFVFSSKRQDGYFVQSFIAKVDENGLATKPFVLPQKSGYFYKSFLRSYNIPELVKAPVPASIHDLEEIAKSPTAATEHRFVGESEYFDKLSKMKAPGTKQSSREH